MDDCKINLTDPLITQVYTTMVESLNYGFNEFMDMINSICKDSCYQPIIDFSNEIKRYCREEFKRYVERIFREWKEGTAGFKVLAQEIGAGKEREEKAVELMERIERIVGRLFEGEHSDVQVNTAQPRVAKEDILKINDGIDKFLQAIERAKEEAEQNCDFHAETNQAYNLTKPVITMICQYLYEWMKLNKESVIEGSEILDTGMKKIIENADIKGSYDVEHTSWNV